MEGPAGVRKNRFSVVPMGKDTQVVIITIVSWTLCFMDSQLLTHFFPRVYYYWLPLWYKNNSHCRVKRSLVSGTNHFLAGVHLPCKALCSKTWGWRPVCPHTARSRWRRERLPEPLSLGSLPSEGRSPSFSGFVLANKPSFPGLESWCGLCILLSRPLISKD